MKRLIVNADDLGITSGVNQAIFNLGRSGALTSATLMASSAAFEEAVSLSRQSAAPAIGCHIVLVDGTPLLGEDKTKRLAPHGKFRPSFAGFASDLLLRRIPEAEIEVEAIAQIRKLQHAGVQVTHLDTHKHTHMLPGVLRPLLRAALACGIERIRNPFEPQWSIRATPRSGFTRRAQVMALNTQLGAFRRYVDAAGVSTTNGAIGVLATGTLDSDTLSSLLRAVPEGTWELVCHPGINDEALRGMPTRLTHSRETEAAALRELVPTAASLGIELIHFGAL